MVLFSQYLSGVQVPYPSYTKGKGVGIRKMSLFRQFPVRKSLLCDSNQRKKGL